MAVTKEYALEWAIRQATNAQKDTTVPRLKKVFATVKLQLEAVLEEVEEQITSD